MKNVVIPILFLVLTFSAFKPSDNDAKVAESFAIKTLVLDAGHGGKDPGAVGKNSKEKDIALAITLKVGKLVEEKMPEVKVVYTRDKDVFIPLSKRADIANEAKADLFVSIHCNANASSSPKGTETYVMGMDKGNVNLEVMNRENEVIEKEDNKDAYDGVDINNLEQIIPLMFLLNTFKGQSVDVAGAIQNNFKLNTSRKSRGVKEARFYVLLRTYMPSVLVEAGFISNTEEEAYLKSEKGKNQIAQGIFDAIQNYQNKFSTFKVKKDKKEKDKPEPDIEETPKTTTTEKDQTTTKPKEQPLKTSDSLTTSQKTSNDEKTSIEKDSVSNDIKKTETVKPEETNEATSRAKTTDNKEASNGANQTALLPNKIENNTDSLPKEFMSETAIFSIQLATSSRVLDTKKGQFKTLDIVHIAKYNTLYKYYYQSTTTMDKAKELETKAKEAGFKDAFVVAFLKGKRISTQEAKQLLKLE